MARFKKICVAEHQIIDENLDIQDVGHNGAEEYINKAALLECLYKMVTENALEEKFVREEAFREVINLILNIS